MPGDAHSDQEPDDSVPEFVEVDPTNRYGRYSEVLGKGACKTVYASRKRNKKEKKRINFFLVFFVVVVGIRISFPFVSYRAFDELEGIEVAWNQVMVKDVTRKPADLERVYSELHLLQTLKHKNVIKFYGSWVDTEHGNINFITEIFTSGNLRQYRQRHKRVDIRALKNWSRQILSGLFYLHNHDPPVIHRDLKCDNVFVNGSHGEVKIGDLGLAAILYHVHLARSVIGTPEFMAPEFYEEEYNELVDIYAFGMCLLELVTFEYPYTECSNPAQIYRRVSSGIKPASLAKVTDIEVKKFIEKCIANVSERLSARDLLMDPFLQSDVNHANYVLHPSLNHPDENSEQASRESSFAGDNKDMSIKDLTVKGQRKDKNKIFIKLRIPDSTGHVHNIHFPFDIGVDTSTCVASEMVTELNLTDQDVSTIAAMIDLEIQCHIPDWVGGETCCDQYDDVASIPQHLESEGKDELTELKNDSSQPFRSFVLEQLPSGRNYWSDSPRGSPTCTQLNVSSGSGPGASGQGITEVPGREDSHFVRNSDGGLHVGGVPLKNCGDPTNLIGEVKDSSTDILSLEDLSLANKERVSVDNGIVTENESEHMKVIAKKLECLLGEQQKELHELKKKHEEAIANILKDLPLEFRKRTLCRFRLNAPDDIRVKHLLRW